MKWARTPALVFLFAGRAAFGASVEISVSEAGGAPLAGQPVVLLPVTPEIPTPAPYDFLARPAGRCVTDPAGRCVIANVPVGTYAPEPRPILDQRFYAPGGSAAAAFGTVTVSAEAAVVKVRIELPRGVQFEFKVDVAHRGVPAGTVVVLTGESGEVERLGFQPGFWKFERTLGPGAWRVRLEGPPLALLAGIELDGNAVTTVDVPITVRPPDHDRDVTWTLTEPCWVYGNVKSTRKEPGVEVGATLVAPGPWATSPFCFDARSCAGNPVAGVQRNGDYDFSMPCGVWRVAPFGDSLVESTPPFAELALANAEHATASFDVKETDSGTGRAGLSVTVLSPERRQVPSAPVELWPKEGNLGRTAPLATKSTDITGGSVYFMNVADGSYLVRVQVPGCRVAVERKTDFRADDPSTRRMTIQLSRGATIDALVRDENDRPVTGVGCKLTRLDPPPETDDPVARLQKEETEMVVSPSKDQTGHLVISGLAAGSYRVRPVVSGPLADSTTATIGVPGEPKAEELTVQLVDETRTALEIRALPAASFAGRLACADGLPLPKDVEVCILPQPSPDEEAVAREECRHPVTPARMYRLKGDAKDTFQIGPLKPGTVRLGLRPKGYAQWTWAIETPDGARASLLPVVEPEKIELGTITVLCGPAVAIQPLVKSGEALPDLTIAKAEGTLKRTVKDGAVETRRIAAEPLRDRVMFRELPEGDWTLDVSISHPFFVPASPVRVAAPVKLERGGLVMQRPEVADVGGAIAVLIDGTARVVAPSGEERIQPAVDGRILFGGLAPELYRVERCVDAPCTRISDRWPGVQVMRRKMTELELPR